MIVKCDKCSLEYDDLYRWTFCPHDTFAMRTVATKQKDGKTVEKVCTSVEELRAFLEDK